MQWPDNIPEFLTELMRRWLDQYQKEQLVEITKLGLFHWEYRPNIRNPDKPRRRPKIDQIALMNTASFTKAYYFFQVDDITLHVYDTSGFPKAGCSAVIEYVLEDHGFVQKGTLIKMIS